MKKIHSIAMTEKENNRKFITTQLEEHYAMVRDLKGFTLVFFSPKNGKGQNITKHIYATISNTTLENTLIIISSDGTASLSGQTNGCMAWLKRLLG